MSKRFSKIKTYKKIKAINIVQYKNIFILRVYAYLRKTDRATPPPSEMSENLKIKFSLPSFNLFLEYRPSFKL